MGIQRIFFRIKNIAVLMVKYMMSRFLTRHMKSILVLIIQTLVILYLLLYIEMNYSAREPRSDYREDYINLICTSEIFKQDAYLDRKQRGVDNKADENNITNQLISIASKINHKRKMVLFTVINEAYLPFAYSWLCNTKTMAIHDSVLIVTTDLKTKKRLEKDWPEISVVSMNMTALRGNQSYSQVGYIKITVKRTDMIQTLLMANIDVFVFEVDCVWLANPLETITFEERHDIIVNPVSNTGDKIFASGFILLRKTCRSKIIWQKVTDMMNALGKRIEALDEDAVLENYGLENEQEYLANLIRDGYGNVTLKMLPLNIYADGKWYKLPEKERAKFRPIIINNNWIIGNTPKIERAKLWNHWFVNDDLTCDMDLVKKTI